MSYKKGSRRFPECRELSAATIIIAPQIFSISRYAMARLHCWFLAVVLYAAAAGLGQAETGIPRTLVESPAFYVANTVYFHHAASADTVDFIHLVTPTAGADVGNAGIYASRFDATGKQLIESKIDLGSTCLGITCWPLRGSIASPNNYVIAAVDRLATKILLSFVDRTTLASSFQAIPIPTGENLIDVVGNGTDALFVLTGAQVIPSHTDLYAELRIRKYSLGGTQVGPTKSITSVLPLRSAQTSYLGKQQDAFSSLIVQSSGSGDVVFVRMQEAVANVSDHLVLETHLVFAKINFSTNGVGWVFRITSVPYPSTPIVGYSPKIKAWGLDGSGNITIAGHMQGGDQVTSGHTDDGLPFIEDIKGIIVWHLRGDGTLDQYCAWRIPEFNGIPLHDYTLSNIELQPFRDGTLISANAALMLDVVRGANSPIQTLPQSSTVGVVLLARLSSSGALLWSDAVFRSDQKAHDPRCCELRAQDLWSMHDASADVISSSLVRVIAQSSRSPSYSESFNPVYVLDAEEVAVDVDIADTAPTPQFLVQQYLMGWRYSSIKFIQVSDSPN